MKTTIRIPHAPTAQLPELAEFLAHTHTIETGISQMSADRAVRDLARAS